MASEPVAVLSYYATHPQSYYRTGIPNPDFPGVARFFRQLAVPAALHVHFNGAGGNIGAGKYNDGSPANRLVLAERLADGMRRAWENTSREPLSPAARELGRRAGGVAAGEASFDRRNWKLNSRSAIRSLHHAGRRFAAGLAAPLPGRPQD